MRAWPVFFHAPHRVMFFAGMVQGLLAMGWWLLDLAARAGLGLPQVTWPLPPPWVHAMLMLFGFFPFFMFGFLMTAGPRWVGATPVPAAFYVPAFAGMSAGWGLFYAALGWPALLAPGLGLVLFGWCAGLAGLARIVLTPSTQPAHPRIAFAAMAGGALGVAAVLGFVLGGPGWLAAAAIAGGAWCFVVPVFVTVCHRMIPFFSSAVIPGYRVEQPRAALALLVGGSLAHGALAIAGLVQWTWLVDLPAAAAAGLLTWRWQLRRSLAVRLLAMLHIAFAWLGGALALFGGHSLLLLAGREGLGLAPLHALTIGFCASLALAMVTRVTLGHSGRGLGAGEAAWTVFIALQTVAALRVAAEFFPPPAADLLMVAAAGGWLAVFGRWAARYASAYLARRADGGAG